MFLSLVHSLTPHFRRKVKFPFEFDVLDLCTDELKAQLTPVNVALKNISKDRDERAKIRKRMRGANAATAASSSSVSATSTPPPPADATMTQDIYRGTEEEERAKRAEEKKVLEGLISPEIRNDPGANASGLYELCGGSFISLPPSFFPSFLPY